MAKRISVEECNALYRKYGTPARVIAHCRAVCDTALRISRALNAHGSHLDLQLIQGAALSHDVARVHEDHALVGAEILDSLGYLDEAKIVRVHMQYRFNPFEQLNETDMVCLSDRLVKENQYVGLDERIDYILHKSGNDPQIRRKILENKADTLVFMEKIEKRIGQSIDSLCKRKA